MISNVPHNLTEAGKTIAMTIKHAVDNGFKEIEVSQAAEEAWIERLMQGMGRMMGAPDCTPGYYNHESQDPGTAAKYNVCYPEGATAYFNYIKEWRESGEFEGIEFR